MFIQFFTFGLGAFASLGMNLLSYTMMACLPETHSHKAVFVASALTLALAQIHKQVYFPGVNGLDVPMNLMFNFCRVTTLAICASDGLKIKKMGDACDLKSRERKYAITDGRPSFLDYWSYMYFCGAAISGPWYEFKDF